MTVAFAPDGQQIATGWKDGTVRAWRCAICGGIDDLVALADDRLASTGRVPTAKERERYGIG